MLCRNRQLFPFAESAFAVGTSERERERERERESLLACGAEISGRDFKNKEYSDLGAVPECVESLQGETRLVKCTFCFHRFTCLKLK